MSESIAELFAEGEDPKANWFKGSRMLPTLSLTRSKTASEADERSGQWLSGPPGRGLDAIGVNLRGAGTPRDRGWTEACT
jgi:hypothetical protein